MTAHLVLVLVLLLQAQAAAWDVGSPLQLGIPAPLGGSAPSRGPDGAGAVLRPGRHPLPLRRCPHCPLLPPKAPASESIQRQCQSSQGAKRRTHLHRAQHGKPGDVRNPGAQKLLGAAEQRGPPASPRGLPRAPALPTARCARLGSASPVPAQKSCRCSSSTLALGPDP